ncbi:Cysteine--tRNA ligase [BD1-7 clade bacterium]|uniref:Cysteine--tRNA ligase n=1 Tax=BD1-7 clade bacterium TaxID=2029982 RepID=A0A5S9QGB9_9GAMM|nr:Cysteine--tRNA ligase [BD1-7 clade bacterium]CAA0117083.1 Cysteine--tRNA ligase [BD1-7 clade bacterium]
MALKLYNTLKGGKDVFTPIEEDIVKMYVCGPTVYNRVHIGNARPAVVFDTLYRVLKALYGTVIYARNITDIDDKIMNTARESGEAISAITARYTDAYVEDMAALNNLPPDITPLATEHLPEMIGMVQALLDQGHAYEAEGHVLFDVQSMDDYGKLSNRNLEDMLAGARVDVADYKKYAGDFVLWKPSSDEEPGWDSPWGRGRPGWHLECSAMIEKHLGETIDIHGGGRDLIFPHHENEIAQSQCAHGGKQFVRYWMHNGYINIDGEKMSKSLGNFRMVNDLLQHYHGEVLRFALLSAQYRSELNFSAELLDKAKAALDSLYGYLRAIADVEAITPSEDVLHASPLFEAMLDDLNTPLAISEFHSLGKSMKTLSGEAQQNAKGLFLSAAQLLGLMQSDVDEWFRGSAGDTDVISAEAVEALLAEMEEARSNKDYAKSDEIRAQLQEQGITLDRNGWRRA